MKDPPSPVAEDNVREYKERVIEPVDHIHIEIQEEGRELSSPLPEDDGNETEERVTETNSNKNGNVIDVKSVNDELNFRVAENVKKEERISVAQEETNASIALEMEEKLRKETMDEDMCAFASMDNIMEKIVDDQDLVPKDDAIEGDALCSFMNNISLCHNLQSPPSNIIPDESIGKEDKELMMRPLIDKDLSKSAGDNSPASPKDDANYESEQEKSEQEKSEQERSSNDKEKKDPLFLVCNFDENPTTLYKFIQLKQWDSTIQLILSNATEEDGSIIMENISEKVIEEANTWVLRYERDGESLRWKMLCLHAAVFFKGPAKLIDLLIKMSPYSLEERNDQGMLPLHLAFKYHGEIEVIELIMDAFPQAIHLQDYKGRTALQCFTRSKSSISSSLAKDVAEMIQKEKYFWESYNEYAVETDRELILREVKVRYQDQLYQVEKCHLKKVKNLENELQDAKNESAKCRNACYGLISKNEACLANEEKLTNDLLQSQNEAQNSEEKLKQSFSRVSILEKEIEEMELKIQETKSQYNTLEKEFLVIEKLKNDNEAAKKKNETLTKTNKLLNKTIEDLNANANELVADRDKCRRQAGSMLAWKGKAEQMGTSNKALQEKLKQITVSYRSISQDKQESDLQATNLSLSNEILQNNLDDMTNQFENEKNEKSKCESEFKLLQVLLQQQKTNTDDIMKKHKAVLNDVKVAKKILEDKLNKLNLKLHREEELNVTLKKTISNFIKVVESNVREAEKKIQDMVMDPAINQICKKGSKTKSESKRNKVIAILENRIIDAEEKLQRILDKRNPRVETLPMAKDFISTHLVQLTTEYEIISYERDLWKLKSEEMQEKMQVMNDENVYNKKMESLGGCQWLFSFMG